MFKMKKIVVSAWIALIIITPGIRLIAAKNAYPVPGDAGHFVQHGVALAHGIPGAMSPYWSQGMTLIAAGAERAGLDPRRALQATAMISGIAFVYLFSGLIWRLTRSPPCALLGGFWAAVNSTLIHYSIVGYSEMPYIMLLTAGAYASLMFMGKTQWLWTSGVLLGGGGYFKGLDAAVAAIALATFHFITSNRSGVRRMALALEIPLVSFLILIPLCTFTYMETGTFAPGNKGRINFALGKDWADSKIVYAAEGAKLEDRPINEILHQIPNRIAHNVAQTCRLFNEQIFYRGLRIGTIWFGLLAAGTFWVLIYCRDRRTLLPVLLLAPQLMLLWIVFVHSRIIVPTVPWVMLLAILAGHDLIAKGSRVKNFVLSIAIFYLCVNTVYAPKAYLSEYVGWRYENVMKCAGILKKMGTEADVVMNYGPHLAIEFNKTNPLNTVEVPYGNIEQVEDVAKGRRVRWIIISDQIYPHWPITRLFSVGAAAPTNWCLRQELSFPACEALGRPAEKCRIYERIPQLSSSL